MVNAPRIADVETFKSLYLSKEMNYNDIATFFGVNRTTVFKTIVRLGLQRRGHPTKKLAQTTEETYVLLVALCENCQSSNLELMPNKKKQTYRCKVCEKEMMTPKTIYHSTKTKTVAKNVPTFNKEQFIADYRAGMSQAKLANKYRLSNSTAKKRLIDFGVFKPSPNPKPVKKQKPKMESLISENKPLQVDNIVKRKPFFAPTLQELRKQELEAKINAIRKIERMSRKETESYLDDDD